MRTVVQRYWILTAVGLGLGLQPSQSAVESTGTDPSVSDQLTQFTEASERHSFSGKPITLQVRDAEVTDVLRLIAEASGFNMIVADEVKGKITLSLIDVPWDQVLEVVLHTMSLGAERNNNVLRIVPLANLTRERQVAIEAKSVADASAPRVTRIFPISYADATSLQTILNQFGNSGSGARASGSGGSVSIDARTNSIIVRDSAENVEKMKKLIELLDTQTPQVLVEAKIVEATENFSRTLGGNIGMGLGSRAVASFNGANPTGSLLPDVYATGAKVGEASTGGGAFGFGPQLGIFGGTLTLNATLALGESEGSTKIVSSPKTVVLNKEQAKITQSQPTVLTQTVAIPGGATQTSTIVAQANISLNVTPTVTNDENVLMHLDISRDVPVSVGTGQTATANRNMSTKVLVQSGATLVIGGIHIHEQVDSEAGLPFFRKIPIIGWLFGKEDSRTAKTELLIFVTPRILNTKEAGLTAG